MTGNCAGFFTTDYGDMDSDFLVVRALLVCVVCCLSCVV
jgi:hypothetical protein